MIINSQSKLESFIEALLNVLSGAIISYLMWKFGVGPAIEKGYLTIQDSFKITAIFTITSVIRSYVWRRVFNKKLLHIFVERNEYRLYTQFSYVDKDIFLLSGLVTIV